MRTLTVVCLLSLSGLLGFNLARPAEPQRPHAGFGAETQPPPSVGKRKRALLVGISHYKKDLKSGLPWNDLHTKHEIEQLASVLISDRFRFRAEDIKILCDDAVVLDGKTIPPSLPTRRAIVDAFRRYLIDPAQPGDTIFFHFSGHGSQVTDGPRHVDELDGLDEVLITSDYKSCQDGSNDLRDDEIGRLLGELNDKKPATVMISIDSCFSGTATRGDYLLTRGGTCPGRNVTPYRGGDGHDGFNDLLDRREAESLNYVFFSAADSNQLAKERDDKAGSYYTLALIRALQEAGPTTTYHDLFEQVYSEVKSNCYLQTPRIEGRQKDQLVFAEGGLPSEPFLSVRATGDPAHPLLLAGRLQGMTVGSRFTLCPAKTKSRAECAPVGVAEIRRDEDLQTNQSILTIKGGTLNASQAPARAYEVFHNYESVLTVAVKADVMRPELQAVLSSSGFASPVAEQSPKWNVLIRRAVKEDDGRRVVAGDSRSLVLQHRAGDVFASVSGGPDWAASLKDALIKEAKRQTLIRLETNNPHLRVKLRLVPVNVEFKKNAAGKVNEWHVQGVKPGGFSYAKNGAHEVKIDEWYRLEAFLDTRRGELEAAFITILNLDSNGEIRPVFPRSTTYDDNLLDARQWKPVAYLHVSEPLGLQSLRAIATEVRTDFSPLFQVIGESFAPRGKSAREQLEEMVEALSRVRDVVRADALRNAIQSPIGQIFLSTQEGDMKTRGFPVAGTSSWATTSLSYVVVEK